MRLTKPASRWKRTIAATTLLLAASACAGGAASPDGCAGWKPIRPTPTDIGAISQALADQILDHNEFGARQCGWGA
ncbi:MAG: hypothetical protein ACE5Q3_18050 [Alphaproteobacteria bacterium]